MLTSVYGDIQKLALKVFWPRDMTELILMIATWTRVTRIPTTYARTRLDSLVLCQDQNSIFFVEVVFGCILAV